MSPARWLAVLVLVLAVGTAACGPDYAARSHGPGDGP